MNITTTCTKFNNDYNVIKMTRDNFNEFYLEKISYGDLFFMCGAGLEELSPAYVWEAIAAAEKEGFWQD